MASEWACLKSTRDAVALTWIHSQFVLIFLSHAGGILYVVWKRMTSFICLLLLAPQPTVQVELSVPLSSDSSGMAGVKYSSAYLSLAIFGGNGPSTLSAACSTIWLTVPYCMNKSLVFLDSGSIPLGFLKCSVASVSDNSEDKAVYLSLWNK